MYHHATFCPLSRLRFFVVWAVLLVGTAKEGYGQRVYANASSVATDVDRGCILLVCGTVNNPMNPVTMTQILNGQPSRIIAPLALSTTKHNIRFIETNTLPTPYAPVMVKIKINASILSLVNSVSIQRTNNGVNNIVGSSYSVGTLLDLLGIGGVGNEELTVILPVPGTSQANNGVQVAVSSAVTLGLSADLFYAFYITPPQLTNNEVFRCEEEIGEVTINNFQTGYTYRLYTAEIGGTEIPEAATTTATLTFPSNLEGTYWLEARENDIYPSARTEINITVVPQPGHPELTITDMPD